MTPKILTYIILFLNFCATNSMLAQSDVFFINKTGRPVWIENQTATGIGGYPTIISKDSSKINQVSLAEKICILQLFGIPEKGVYGTRDAVYYLLRSNDTVLITKGIGNRVKLFHITSKERTKEFAFIYALIDELGSSDNFVFNNYLKKRKSPYSIVSLISAPLKVRDKEIESFYMRYIKKIDKNGSAASISKETLVLYSSFFWYALIRERITNNDIPLSGSKKNYYMDSIRSWLPNFQCDDCLGMYHYRQAVVSISSILFGTSDDYISKVAAIFTGKTRDFIISRYMLDLMETKNKQLDIQFPIYNTIVKTPLYKTIIADNYSLMAVHANDQVDSIWLVSHDKKKISFSSFLNMHKGKVIYIDFWASWCKPCIEMLPYSHELNKKLGKEKVIFAYISTDVEYDSWKNAVKKLNLMNSNSFILDNASNRSIAKKWMINTIPRYIIIDKDGKMVDKDAGRPSEIKVYDQLFRLSK